MNQRLQVIKRREDCFRPFARVENAMAALGIPASTSTLRYLTTKKNKLGHALSGL